MHLEITFRDGSELVVDRIEIDTGQLFWTRLPMNGHPDDDSVPNEGQMRLEEIKSIRPFTYSAEAWPE